MSIKNTRVWKHLSSIKLAIWLLAIIAAASLVGTFLPQREIYSSLWFILLLIIFSINLAVCVINRFSLKRRMLGSILSHVSMLVILAGVLIGMFFGQKGFIRISEGQEVSCFEAKDKRHVNLGFSLRLDKFIYSEHIDLREKLLIYPAEQDKNEGLIAGISAETGTESNIADTGYSVKVLRYVNDFAMDIATKEVVSRSAKPNNPAIQVELKDKAGVTTIFWVFARFPDMHQKMGPAFKFIYRWVGRRPKDFISDITVLKDGKEVLKKSVRVNDPLRFGGYTFFQSSYDTEQLSWSGLEAAKDPGVGVVYLGFTMLTIGLIIIFYINPLMKK